ncbi:PREDICTED: transmembrane protein 165 [Myotis brandtii]|nr:PREDICTED: transmembrane protein 165 [Myotis brandtii]
MAITITMLGNLGARDIKIKDILLPPKSLRFSQEIAKTEAASRTREGVRNRARCGGSRRQVPRNQGAGAGVTSRKRVLFDFFCRDISLFSKKVSSSSLVFCVDEDSDKGLTPAVPVHTNKEDTDTQTNLGFIHAFVAAISVIIVSELGDKTFFIAAIMAMRYNRLTVLAGAMLALGLMTCLSVLFGYATTVIPRVYTYYVSTALFAIFGIRMLREGLKMSPDEGQEELEEVQAELKKKDEEFQRTKLLNGPGDVETGTSTIPQKKWLHFISPIFVQALTLTFLAEWGDRSQLTTIVLAAREDPYGVAVGGTVGHCLCTGLAVIGGRMIAQKISVRTVTIIGGIVFLAFAFSALFISPDSGF